MPTINDLETAPGFEKLSYQEQTMLRSKFFDKYVAQDPNFQRLQDSDKLGLFDKAVTRPPVLEAKDSDYFRNSAAAVVGMKMGDVASLDKAIGLSAFRNGTKQMLLPTLATKGVDVVMQLFDPDVVDPVYSDYYGKDGTKVDQWLQMNVQKYGGEAAVQKMRDSSLTIGLIGGFAEFALMTVALGAAGSALGKAGVAGIAGPGIMAQGATRGAAMGRGILTGEYLNTATRAALATTRFSSPLLTGLTALTVEGVTSGAVQTGLDMLRLGIQSEFENKTNKEVWDTIAMNFGVNVAMNYVGWGAMKAMGTVGKGLLKAGKGVELDALTNFKKVFQMDTNPATKAASRKYIEETVAPAEANARAVDIDPKGVYGLKVIAQSAGWDLELNADETVRSLWNIGAPNIKFENISLKDARRKIAEIVTTNVPSDAPRVKDLKSLQGQASMLDTKTTLIRQISYKLNEKFTPEQVSSLLLPENGVVNRDNLNVFARSYLLANGVSEDVIKQVNIKPYFLGSGTKPPSEGLNIIVNSHTRSVGGEGKFVSSFIEDLDNVIDVHGKPQDWKPFTFVPPPVEMSHSSLTAIKAAAEALGVPVQMKNMNIMLNGQTYTSTREAHAAILDMARKAGKLSPEQLSSIMGQKFGLSIREIDRTVMSPGGQGEVLAKRLKGETGITVKSYEVFKITPKGKVIVASAPDLDTLFKNYPDIDPGLPSSFAPTRWIVDPEKGTLTVQNTIVTGSSTKLIELAGQYTSPISAKVISKKLTESITEGSAKLSYVLRNDDFGVWAEYSSPKAAYKALNEATDMVTKRKSAFAMRNMTMMHSPDGSIVAVAADGSGKKFASVDEAEAWLKATPYADWIEEMLPVEPTLLVEAQKQASESAQKLAQVVPDHRLVPNRIKSGALGKVTKWLFPTEMALTVAQRQHGKTDLLKMFREMATGTRLAQGMDNKGDAVISQIFKGIKYDRKVMYQILAGNDPSKWAEIAQRGFKHTLNEADKLKLEEIVKYYDTAFPSAGIADWKRVFGYASRIRDYALSHPNDIPDAISAGDYLRKSLGDVPTGFSLFADNARATDVLKFALTEDAEQVMRQYTYALNKKRYMDPLIKDMRVKIGELDGKFPKDELDFFRGALNELQPEVRLPTTGMFKDHSKQAVMGIQKILQGIPGLRSMPMATAPVVGDIIDMFNQQMTVATQAKPWAVLRNTFQINLLGATIGNNKIMWDSFRDVINEPADETVKRVIGSGAVRGGGFVGSTPGTSLNMWRSLMKWNENMDVMTRATAFKAADKLIDAAWPMHKAGKISAEEFVKRSSLSVLDEPQRLVILDALNRGDETFAKDYFGDSLNRLVFFDYSKMNRTTFQRGVMGKIFGKFGTYPAATIALYERLLSSGTFGERAAKAARVVFNATAIYEGMKLAGIDYQGFQWQDPFGFQGGPLWHLMADGSQFIGNSSQNKQARASLLRNLPRLISPEVNTFQQVQRSLILIGQGDVYSAAIALMGAPVRKDLAWKERP